MPLVLTTAITIENGARLLVGGAPRIDDDAAVMLVVLELRSPGGTNYLIARRVVTVRNGACDRVVRATPPAGSNAEEKLGLELGAVTVADGFDQALSAWAGGAGANARRNALLSALLAIGVIDASLTGTVS